MISVVISPAFYILCLAICTVFLKNKRWKRVCGVATVSLFLLFSNGPLFQFVAGQWYSLLSIQKGDRTSVTADI